MRRASRRQGATLNNPDHCGDPPLLLAAGNGALARRGARARAESVRMPKAAGGAPRAGHLAIVKLLLDEGADIQQAGAVRGCGKRGATARLLT